MSRIRIPRRSDRIGIIGAGPAGLYTAHLLAERGYSRVSLLEKGARFGGMSLTLHRDGIPHEMGTCFLHPGYHQVFSLLEKLGMQAPVSPASPRGHEIHINGTSRSLFEWMLGSSGLPGLFAGARMLASLRRYNALYRELLPGYRSGLPPRPEQWERLRVPFASFLRANGLDNLIPLFWITMFAQGYGDLETTPALFGLWWITPDLTGAIMQATLGRPALLVLPQGWGEVWRRLVARHDLDITLNAHVARIERPAHGPVRVSGTRGGRHFKRDFEHLVMAAPMQHGLRMLHDPVQEERRVFSALRASQMGTLLFEARSAPDGHCIKYWPQALQSDTTGHVHGVRNSAQSLGLDSTRPTFVAHQYSPSPLNRQELYERALGDLQSYGFEDVRVLDQRVWSYAPRFDQEGLDAELPWRLDALQGQRRTWYVGGSVCFDSVHDITSHAYQLVDRFLGSSLDLVKDAPIRFWPGYPEASLSG